MAFLDRENIVAKPGHSRWLIPPAALCVHLCIGQAYAFSVFNLPLTKILGVSESLPADWELTTLGWIFSLAMVFLGLAAAFGGTWVERAGPRKAMFTAACCFCGGFVVSAIGVYTHSIILLYLGYGVLGGIGLGIGYISPVKTLILWFPDRPGMATGMAIMGFGGGAMIGAPLGVGLMAYYASPGSVGVASTFITMAAIYFVFMCIGATIVRVPRPGWKPAGFVESNQKVQKLVTRANVNVKQAMRTPQFYLLWFVLFLNTTAGIGVLGQASAMSQEMMPGAIEAAAAAGFVGLLSLFNMGGRFAWATTSDYIGRKNTYITFFALGMALYALVTGAAAINSVLLYVLCYCVIISMYGGGFSTIPAYLKDIFGTMNVGAIHGRILTAWSAAGVAGPVLVNYIRAAQIDSGVPPAQAYTITMYIMVGLLLIGLICNLCVKPVDARHHHAEEPERDSNLGTATAEA